MIESDLVLKLFALEGKPDYRLIFNEELLHPEHDEIYINDINFILIELQQISKGTFDYKKQKKTDSIVIYHSLQRLSKLENYEKFLNHPIHINEFKDKYGNVFLQARASYNMEGKIKYLNAYVGALGDYTKGNKDKAAIRKGKTLLRAKLKDIYKIN